MDGWMDVLPTSLRSDQESAGPEHGRHELLSSRCGGLDQRLVEFLREQLVYTGLLGGFGTQDFPHANHLENQEPG